MAVRSALVKQLQAAIKSSGKTRYLIAQESGVDESALARFANHGKGLSLANMEKVCSCIGVCITLQSVVNPSKKQKR